MAAVTEATASGPTPAPADPRQALRAQLRALVPAELKRVLLTWRIWPVAFLALSPAGILFLRFLKVRLGSGGMETAADVTGKFAIVFQTLDLRTTLFFGCAVLATALVRGELLARTLHYYLLTPLSRGALLVGKYLAGLATATILYGASVVAQAVLVYLPQRSFDGLAYLTAGAGRGQLVAYVAVIFLAAAAYLALFLWLAFTAKNPLIPAVAVLGWEGINFLLPPALKVISVLYWLQSLCPVPVSAGPFSLPAEPAPAWLAVLVLLGQVALFLALAARRLRRLDVAYSE